MKPSGEPFLSDHCAALNLFICECEMYILYNENIKKEIFLMFPCATLDFEGKNNVYLQCFFSINEKKNKINVKDKCKKKMVSSRIFLLPASQPDQIELKEQQTTEEKGRSANQYCCCSCSLVSPCGEAKTN